MFPCSFSLSAKKGSRYSMYLRFFLITALLWFRNALAALIVASDVKQLEELADFASIAYCVNKGLNSGLLKSSCSKPFCENHKNVEIIKVFNFNELGHLGQGYYAVDHNKGWVILTFRGTSSYRDWIQDFDIKQVPYLMISGSTKCKNCKIHRGFHKFLVSNCATIVSEVTKLKGKKPDYKLVIVGHSLGGALAHLTGLEFQVMGYSPLVVTYGEPMVGNLEFAEFSDLQFGMNEVAESISRSRTLGSGHIRVVHISDPVPHQPLIPSYSYCGYEYFINKDSFPHSSGNIERKGLKTGSSIIMAMSDWNPSKLIPDNPINVAHRNYFRRITGCKDE